MRAFHIRGVKQGYLDMEERKPAAGDGLEKGAGGCYKAPFIATKCAVALHVISQVHTLVLVGPKVMLLMSLDESKGGFMSPLSMCSMMKDGVRVERPI